MTELLELARRIAEQARPGEQVEAFVARSRRFGVRAYDREGYRSPVSIPTPARR